MSKKLYEESNIQDIASAIREKNGTQNTYTTAQMGNAVRAIKTPPILQEKTIIRNGPYTPDSGYEGFSRVIAAVSNTYNANDEGKVVSNGALKSQTEVTITENGPVDTTEIKRVLIDVPPTGGTGILISKTFTQNGTYNALLDDNADGYSEVIIKVQGGESGRSPRCDQNAIFDWGNLQLSWGFDDVYPVE